MFKKIGKAIEILRIIIALIPFIRQLIEAVEIPGNGTAKKAAVLEAVGGIIDNLPWEIADDVKESVLAIISGIVDLIVGILNLLGHDWGQS